MKIAVIGYSGSGKSTLAAKLAERHGVPLLHLDRVQFLPGWQERTREEKIKIVAAFLDGNDAWVIDGNYSSVLQDRRLQEADRIIFMNFNRVSCFFRALRRYRKYKGTSRSSVGEGCPEKLDREFLRQLLFKGRKRSKRLLFKGICQRFSDKVEVLRNQRELEKFEKKEGLPCGW